MSQGRLKRQISEMKRLAWIETQTGSRVVCRNGSVTMELNCSGWEGLETFKQERENGTGKNEVQRVGLTVMGRGGTAN